MNPSTNAVVVIVNESNEWLRHTIVYNAFASISTGIVSGLLMALVVWRIKRRVEKRDDFKDAVLPVLADIETATDDEIPPRYNASRPVVRDAAAKFSSYIGKRKRRAFDAAWRKYCGIKDDSLEPRWDITTYPDDLVKILGAPNREAARREIVRLLNVLIELAG